MKEIMLEYMGSIVEEFRLFFIGFLKIAIQFIIFITIPIWIIPFLYLRKKIGSKII